jgi:hypothetical protein
MTSDRILRALALHLQAHVEAAGGTFLACDTPEATLAALGQAPGKWRCLLQWQQEVRHTEGGLMKLQLVTVVQQARGLALQAGLDAHTHRAGDPALLMRHNQVCAWMRGASFAGYDDIDARGCQLQHAQWLLDDDRKSTRQLMAQWSLIYAPGGVADTALELDLLGAPTVVTRLEEMERLMAEFRTALMEINGSRVVAAG